MDVTALRDELYCSIYKPCEWVSWIYEGHGIQKIEHIKDDCLEAVKNFEPIDYSQFLERELMEIVIVSSNRIQLDLLLGEVFEYTEHLILEKYLKNQADRPDLSPELFEFIDAHTTNIGFYLHLFLSKLGAILSKEFVEQKTIFEKHEPGSFPVLKKKDKTLEGQLTLLQLSMYCFYAGIPIPRDTGDIPKEIRPLLNGRKGSNLYNKYNDYLKSDRLANRGSEETNRNHVARLTGVIKVLKSDGRSKAAEDAKNDLETFVKKFHLTAYTP